MEETSLSTLDKLKNLDIKTIDPETLVDIRDVKIDMEKPPSERLQSFLKQIKNPYFFRVGKMVVKATYADTDLTIEDCIEAYLRTL